VEIEDIPVQGRDLITGNQKKLWLTIKKLPELDKSIIELKMR
jgi:hypothetical protein